MAGAPPPDGAEVLTAKDRRWVNCINVQGNCASADNYHCGDTPDGGCVLAHWDNDLGDWSPDDFVAHVITIPPLRSDPAFGDAMNTASTQVIYAGPAALARMMAPRSNGTVGISNGTIRPWDEFDPPPLAETLHGIWLPDDMFELHQRAQEHRGWREWCDHLPDAACETVKGRRVARAGRRG